MLIANPRENSLRVLLHLEYHIIYETALLNEHENVIDKRKCVVLLLLDLSAAFDIDRHKHAAYMLLCKHDITSSVGVHRQCMSWIVAYAGNRVNYQSRMHDLYGGRELYSNALVLTVNTCALDRINIFLFTSQHGILKFRMSYVTVQTNCC